MSTLPTLADAFAELERRADVATAQRCDDVAPAVPVRRRARPLLIAASVTVTLGVAGGAALLAHGDRAHPDRAGGLPPTAPPTRGTASTSPTFEIPQTAQDLATRFRAVLGELATFTVTDTGAAVTITLPPTPAASEPLGQPQPNGAASTPNGAAIVGELTSAGVTGGYDIQIFQNSAGGPASCDDPSESRCTTRATADGGSLAIGREPLQGAADGVTYQVELVRADGVEFLMHVSNERDPKGESPVLAPQPPLTTAQMVSIVMSDRW
jgi:hypothetical protein